MKIQSRLLMLTLALTSSVVAAALLVSSILIQDSLEVDAKEKLSAVLEARHSALVRYLDRTQMQLRMLANDHTTAESLANLAQAYAKMGPNAQTVLQQTFVAKGRAAPGTKNAAVPASDYARAHATAAPYLRQYHEAFKWDDMLLIDPKGNVVLSVAKEDDFGTNLVSGPWKDTGLARAVVPLLHHAVPGVLSFTDFERYAPSANRPAAFVAMPVFDPEKQLFLGVVAIQLPVQQINELMKDKVGLGETGETFLGGHDGWMLSDTRFKKESTILALQVKTKAMAKVLAGEAGQDLYPDYRGVDAFIAYKPIQPFHEVTVLGTSPQWGVIAKIDRDEVFAEYYDLRLKLLLVGSALLLISFGVATWGARSITRPLIGIRNALSSLSRGELAMVPSLERSDEIGDMAKAAEAFREMTQTVERDHWIAENVVALTSVVSAETSISTAADKVLHLLCEQLKVPVGAIYLWNADAYKRVGAHGLARRNQTDDVFPLGTGLLGQCAKDNQAVVLSPVPAGLTILSAGLVEFPPHELVFYPIAHKSEVLAVLELAAAKSLEPMEHTFLKAACAALGLHLANLQAAEHNLELLGETQRKSIVLKEQQESLQKSNEEMKALTEELRSQAEEMKAQNEELKANQEELRSQQEEMQHKNQMLETQSTQLKDVAQDAQTKARELEQANQYKSEFLANMSHELRTPLNSVLILSKNLAENEDNNLTPEQVESASVISESGTQLLTLINDILDLSKIEAGKLVLINETFPLDDLLAYLRRIFSPQAEKKQLAFTIQVDPALAENITTDRQRLTQVLSNLLSNAIKFTDNGEVSVQTRREQDDLVFEVIDSGIGIPGDKIEHVFGAFQQLDGSTSRKYGGSGLGLAISRHLTGLLGGEITVVSEPGKGSHFVLRLLHQFARGLAPNASARVPDTKVPVRQMSPGGGSSGASIMVVEDDTRLLAILGRMIQALGCVPVCVESAEDALEAIAKQAPQGILLDLGLPRMNGMELMRKLKVDPVTAGIPVYVMSGAADSGEAKVLGALGFLRKPITRDTVAAAIKVMVNTESVEPVKRILLVDDSLVEVAAIQKLFSEDAVELLPAGTGMLALQLLRSQRFDTVILDLKLPDMSGFEWLEKARHLLNPPPVIVYSARDLTEAEVFSLKGVTESIVTKGAFNNRLREEVLAVRAGSRSPRPATPAAGKKLLLVDDDARNLFALTKALRGKGYVVEVAANSARALESLNAHRFDAVLTDIMMPDMDGYALIRQIRSLGYAELPIIAITAKAMQGDADLCLQAGANAYLAKPVDMHKLLELLKGV
jgi:signal transduction histidine kinase/CheY-like chemotaxis protein/HAMP domain-containing protein